MLFDGKNTKRDLADRLRETAEDLVELVGAQLRLTRLELLTDARTLGTRLLRLAAFVPLVLIGYAFVMGAITIALGQFIGFGWALLLVGALNLAVGAWGSLRAVRAVREVRLLDRSRDEIERSVGSVVAAASPSTPSTPDSV
jgi:uncharacterized membrane protein YqjE